MTTPLERKSTPAEIAARFDQDVERFANLDTGQSATIDAPLVLELLSQAAPAATPAIRRVLDVGCGAGNNTLKLLQTAGPFDCDLLDLSAPMLARAGERVAAGGAGQVRLWHGDFRALELPPSAYDVIFAAAVLHHLRDDADWEAAFRKLYDLTAPGGSVWISDLVAQENTAVQALMWSRYGDYLRDLGGEEYRARVFSYIDREDSPRPVTYQLDLLRRAGFAQVDLLHKNAAFAAFGAVKAPAA
jgi:tRNA (cmo5U34)-methyltransferase